MQIREKLINFTYQALKKQKRLEKRLDTIHKISFVIVLFVNFLPPFLWYESLFGLFLRLGVSYSILCFGELYVQYKLNIVTAYKLAVYMNKQERILNKMSDKSENIKINSDKFLIIARFMLLTGCSFKDLRFTHDNFVKFGKNKDE